MSSAGAAPRAAVPVSNARAEASRRNGAMSRGPKTTEGKARSSRNALKHGLRAAKHVVLPDEDAAGFAALEAALIAELAPKSVLQRIVVGRIARAAWRLERAERIEVDLFAERLAAVPGGGVGLALIRDGNGTRSFETLLRYRGAAQAELWRALRTLKALQAEAACRHGGAGRVGATCPSEAGHAQAAHAALGPPRAGATRTAPEAEQTRAEISSEGTRAALELHPTRTGSKAARALRIPEPERTRGRFPTPHRLAWPRSRGSKTTSSLMPSGSAKKTA